MIREIQSLLPFLDDKQLAAVLEECKHKERIEILPDIIHREVVLTYNNKIGRYQPIHSLKSKLIHEPVILGRDTIIYLDYNFYLFEDHGRKLTSLYHSSISVITIIKLDNKHILCPDLEAIIKYENKKMTLIKIDIGELRYAYHLVQNRFILDSSKVFRIDGTSITEIPINIGRRNSNIFLHSLGRDKPILVIAIDSTINRYIYDLEKGEYKEVSTSNDEIATDNVVLIYHKLHGFNGNNLIDMKRDIEVTRLLTNDIFTMNYQLCMTTDLFRTHRMLYDSRDVMTIPLAYMNQLVIKYKEVIPNLINNNVKDLILQFCRSDKVVIH